MLDVYEKPNREKSEVENFDEDILYNTVQNGTDVYEQKHEEDEILIDAPSVSKHE